MNTCLWETIEYNNDYVAFVMEAKICSNYIPYRIIQTTLCMKMFGNTKSDENKIKYMYKDVRYYTICKEKHSHYYIDKDV